MQSSHTLDRLSVAFSDPHAVAHAGLLLPATLAEKLGLRELIDQHVRLGSAPGAANSGVKAMTLIYSALAGGDCIDDAALLRSASTAAVLAHLAAQSSAPPEQPCHRVSRRGGEHWDRDDSWCSAWDSQ